MSEVNLVVGHTGGHDFQSIRPTIHPRSKNFDTSHELGGVFVSHTQLPETHFWKAPRGQKNHLTTNGVHTLSRQLGDRSQRFQQAGDGLRAALGI